MEGRATTFARRALRVLDANPVVKLAGAVLVAGMSLYAFVDSRLQRSEEARRGGWADPPSVRMLFDQTHGRCTLANLGPRELREVTLSWAEYYVTLDPCSLPARGYGAGTTSKETLTPREHFSIERDAQSVAALCDNAKKHPVECEVGGKCQIVVECRARYHRAADLQPFAASVYAVVEDGCRSLKGVPPFVTGIVGRSRETELLQERAWRCLAARRPASDVFLREVEEFERTRPSDPLAAGRW